MHKISPKNTESWKKLLEIFQEKKNLDLLKEFKSDTQRAKKFSIVFNDILVDYSKNLVDNEIMKNLLNLCQECKLSIAIESMFSGQVINETENRSVLHVALRSQDNIEDKYDNQIFEDIQRVLLQMKDFCHAIEKGIYRGYTGKKIKNIVNIGIGGSDLGPAMVCRALRNYSRNDLNIFFVSNIDGEPLSHILNKLNREDTLFIISSKTFTTQETMLNANKVKAWFLDEEGTCNEAIKRHFIAVTANLRSAVDFGVVKDNIFAYWDFVGGRYSLWSAIGISIALYIGFDNFLDLLRGAEEIDNHFRNSDFDKNIPVILALLGIWYNNFHNTQTHLIVPYEQCLEGFPTYLQQCDMESNGKSIDRSGKIIDYQTGPIIWGAPGTNSQHAFFQLLHQGTKAVPIDFLVGVNPSGGDLDQHQILVANCIAQTKGLMIGKTLEEVKRELKNTGNNFDEDLIFHKYFTGNKPSTTIIYNKLTPKVLGSLIAIYEHKIFTQGVIWNIFSFDQWGVELGKNLSKELLSDILSGNTSNHDQSTNNLLNFIKKKTE